MANLKWSWMFSDEDDTTMGLLGWTLPGTGVDSANTYIYSYAGDPMRLNGLRWSGTAYFGQTLTGPPNTAGTSGSISVPIYLANTPTTFYETIRIMKDGTSTTIAARPTGVSSLGLYINNILKETVSGLQLQNAWNYITLKYDMSVNPWSAQLFVNGSGSGISYTESIAAAVATNFSFVGSSQTPGTNMYIGQVALYSDWVDTEKIRYVTRVNPTVDTSESGSWTPSVGSDNFAVISGSFSTSQYCENTGSEIGQNVVCQVTGALGLITQLGMSPSVIDGVTVHCWASGSGQNAVAGVSDNNSVWTTGSAITPSSSPTYGYSSVSTQPSDGAVWNATSSLYIKYEIV